MATTGGGPMQAHAFRLRPNDELVPSLLEKVKTLNLSSAFILTAVGSLSYAKIRLASAKRQGDTGTYVNDILELNEKMEVTSLVRTLTPDGKKHIHITVSKADGSTVGGHLVTGTVFTTCEIVLGSIDGVKFTREMDEDTGYEELSVGSCST